MPKQVTWTNDSLVVGFGPRRTEVVGAEVKTFGGLGADKVKTVVFDYKEAQRAAANVNVPVPADSLIVSVVLDVIEAFVGGTKIEVGLTGGDVDGFISASQGATAELTLGRHIVGAGAHLLDADDADSTDGYEVGTSADTVDVLATGTFTAGKAVLTVTYR